MVSFVDRAVIVCVIGPRKNGDPVTCPTWLNYVDRWYILKQDCTYDLPDSGAAQQWVWLQIQSAEHHQTPPDWQADGPCTSTYQHLLSWRNKHNAEEELWTTRGQHSIVQCSRKKPSTAYCIVHTAHCLVYKKCAIIYYFNSAKGIRLYINMVSMQFLRSWRWYWKLWLFMEI